MRIGHLIFAELVQATARVDVLSFYHGDSTADQTVAVPQIHKQNVEVIKVIQEQNVVVIKVILQEQCQQMSFFF